jgi:hypothetical protein
VQPAALHRDFEDVVGADLYRCRRFTQPVAKQRTELTGDLLCRRYQCPNSRGVVLFKRPHDGRVEHLPGFHSELECIAKSVLLPANTATVFVPIDAETRNYLYKR